MRVGTGRLRDVERSGQPPEHNPVKVAGPRRSTSYISGVWPASPPPHSTLHGRAYHVFAFHLKRAGESRTRCDWRHFGRLAGFTNQKKERRLDNGLQPFVKLRCSEGRVYSRAAEFLREVEELKGEPLLRPEPQRVGAALAYRCTCSANYFVPREFTLRSRSSPRGSRLGFTRRKSWSLGRTNRA
jgi:RepB DNA-primase from phage plasmid